MSFTDYDFAIRFRNVIRTVVEDILDRDRPADKIGRVVDIDRSGGTALVVYAGDEVNSLRVKIYPSIQPSSSDRVNGPGKGSIVRVSGPPGGRYVAQVLNGGAHQVNSRLVDPSISSGGSSDSTLRSMFSFSTTGVPPKDGVTGYPAIQLIFPFAAGTVEVHTEMLGAGESYIQRDKFAFDTTTVRHTNIPTSTQEASSTGMYLQPNFYLNYGDDYGLGLPHSTAIMGLIYFRDSASTKNPTRMNINLDCRGTNVELLQYNNGAF